MGMQPIFEPLYRFQREQQRHHRVVAALTLTLCVNGPKGFFPAERRQEMVTWVVYLFRDDKCEGRNGYLGNW